MKRKKNENTLKFENQLCFRLYAAHRAVTRAYSSLLDPLGLTYLQYLVMLILWEEETLTIKSLGERLQLDSGTLTPLLKKMEQKGFVLRKRSDVDERSVLIEITRVGKNLRQAAISIPEELFCRLEMTSSKAKDLKALLDEILRTSKEES